MSKYSVRLEDWLKVIEKAITESKKQDGVTCRELADFLNVSRDQMREMLRQLSDEGFISCVRVFRPAICGRLLPVPGYRLVKKTKGKRS